MSGKTILAGCLCLLMLMICSGCSRHALRGSRETTQTVVVEGVGPLDSDIFSGRDRAIEDALRRAVQRVVGVLVQSRTVTEMAELVESKIVTEAFGYVESYQIISEHHTDNQYFVKLEAVVNVAKIRRDIGKHTIIISKKPSLPVLDELILPYDPSLGAFLNRHSSPILIRVNDAREWIRVEGNSVYFTHLHPGQRRLRVAYTSREGERAIGTETVMFNIDREAQDAIVHGKMVGWRVLFYSASGLRHIRFIK